MTRAQLQQQQQHQQLSRGNSLNMLPLGGGRDSWASTKTAQLMTPSQRDSWAAVAAGPKPHPPPIFPPPPPPVAQAAASAAVVPDGNWTLRRGEAYSGRNVATVGAARFHTISRVGSAAGRGGNGGNGGRPVPPVVCNAANVGSLQRVKRVYI